MLHQFNRLYLLICPAASVQISGESWACISCAEHGMDDECTMRRSFGRPINLFYIKSSFN